MNLYTVRFFAKAIKYGTKYVYQTVPRLLTIWLDLGEDAKLASNDSFIKLNDAVSKAIKETPVYKVNLPDVVGYVLSFSSSVVRRLPPNCISSGP
jgi:serine/threonine-protein kinase ATR